MCVEGRCRQHRQLLRQKVISEQQRLLGKPLAAQSKCDSNERSSSTFLADDNSLLIGEVDTGLCLVTASITVVRLH